MAAREGRVVVMVGECVLLVESSVKSIHDRLNGILSPSPSFFSFLYFLIPSQTNSLSLSSSSGYSLSHSVSLFYGLYPSLTPHSSCLACHSLMSVMSFRTKKPSLPGM